MKNKCVVWFLVVSCLSAAWTVAASELMPFEAVCFDTSVCDESDDDVLLSVYTCSLPQMPQLFVSDEVLNQPIFSVIASAVIRGPPV